MFNLRQGVIWTVAVPLIMLATSGCATKKYVSQQVKPVNNRVSQLEKTTNDRISYLNNKEQSDISQVNERISTTDQRVSQTAEAAQQAQGTASRAMEEVESSGSGVANALNYQQVEKADVTFACNKDTLTPEAKVALDMIASKVQSLPRAVVEVVGFADKSGSSPYNLALSRRRAEAVERYLVMQKVPLRSIHIVGLGGEAPPPGLVADEMEINPGAGKTQYSRLARRVHIRVFGAGDITQGSASRVQ
jgi:outer membrane protein OmpA-like peptidoglycan-associated protein